MALLTVHGQVLIAIAAHPHALLRELAEAVGVTERTVQAAIADLDAAGYITRRRTGRRNRYTIQPDAPLRHSGAGVNQVGPVLELLTQQPVTQVSDQVHIKTEVSAHEPEQG